MFFCLKSIQDLHRRKVEAVLSAGITEDISLVEDLLINKHLSVDEVINYFERRRVRALRKHLKKQRQAEGSVIIDEKHDVTLFFCFVKTHPMK